MAGVTDSDIVDHQISRDSKSNRGRQHHKERAGLPLKKPEAHLTIYLGYVVRPFELPLYQLADIEVIKKS